MDLASIFHTGSDKKIRYAVVALGDIAQEAMMPGISHTGNSEITAFVTSDLEKAEVLGKKYGVENNYTYEQFDELLKSGKIDAIYLATPNWRHAEFAVPALRAGIHVLLEKPMEISTDECEEILEAQKSSGSKLMLAYRLHFEPATLSLIKKLRDGQIGELRYFSSTFSQMVDPKNHRAKNGMYAGPLYDMGPYPINACRYVFEDEPIEVISATAVHYSDSLMPNTQDTVAVVLRFPKERIAQFVVSYSAASIDSFTVVGTKGSIEMNPGFTYGKPLEQFVKIESSENHESFKTTDQFGGEMKYFSDCILNGRDPEADGEEGLADVRVIEGILKAIETGLPQKLPPFQRTRRIDVEAQLERLSQVHPPKDVHASSPQLGS